MLAPEILERLGKLNRMPVSNIGAPRQASSLAAREGANSGTPAGGSASHSDALQLPEHGAAEPPGPQALALPPGPPLPVCPPVASASSTNSHVPLLGSEACTCWGPYWRIDRTLDEIAPAWRREWQRVEPLLSAVGTDEQTHPEQRAFAAAFPHNAMYVDLETCGFAGAMIFLVGVIHWTPRGLVLSQLLARNYAEEKAVLESLWQTAAGRNVLVTFNGKSFDWPVVHDRSTLHHLGREHPVGNGEITLAPGWPNGGGGLTRQDPRPVLKHYDLLHHCRRRWRTTLPNCRLQTLERFICGRRRVNDIPSQLIPQAYHEFVRSGETRRLHSILHHNALDLVTLLQLSLRILTA